MPKVLLGVLHRDEFVELDKVETEIVRYSPKNVGLELPQNYLELERQDMGVFFFGKLARRLARYGLQVVALDDPKLWDCYHAIRLAELTRTNMRKGASFEQELKRHTGFHKNYWTSQKAIKRAAAFEAPLRVQALQILKRTRSLDGIQKLLKDCNSEREKYMFNKIKAHKPDMVIVGDDHAEALALTLTDYSYVKLEVPELTPEYIALRWDEMGLD
jgi:hypothetical protein